MSRDIATSFRLGADGGLAAYSPLGWFIRSAVKNLFPSWEPESGAADRIGYAYLA